MLYSTYLWLVFTVGALIWLLVLLHTLRNRKWPLIWPLSTRLTLASLETQSIVPVKQGNLGKSAGVYSIQGMRAHMEDSYYADASHNFYAVYDGHGGARCSEYITQHLHESIFSVSTYLLAPSTTPPVQAANTLHACPSMLDQ